MNKVYIEITNVCNLACPFCPKTKRPPRFMSVDEFRIAVEKIRPLTKYVYLHLMGEPLLHPQLTDLLAILREADMHAAMVTNGMLIPKRAEELLAAGLYKISISLHAWEANFGAEMTEAARSHFAACMEFARRSAASGTITALRLWNEDREDREAQNDLNREITRMVRDYFPDDWKEMARGTRIAPMCYLEKEEIFDWPDRDAEASDGRIRCYGLRDQFGILSDGTIVPCCLDHEGDIALGNIFRDDPSEILQSPRACAIHDGFLRGEATEDLCRRCGYARR